MNVSLYELLSNIKNSDSRTCLTGQRKTSAIRGRRTQKSIVDIIGIMFLIRWGHLKNYVGHGDSCSTQSNKRKDDRDDQDHLSTSKRRECLLVINTIFGEPRVDILGTSARPSYKA